MWLITGCSTGFGRELAKLVLERGWRAVVTARDSSKIADIALRHDASALVLPLDVTRRDQIDEVVAESTRRFGRIDVLVNNAGYGYLAAIEEGEDEAVRAMFESNVFGLIDMTKAVLPVMREQRSGFIVNVSSIGGLASFAATGYYHGTKYAVEGISESLAAEVKPLGIHVLIVEPGPFRTNWAGPSIQQSASVSTTTRRPRVNDASRPRPEAVTRRETRSAVPKPSSMQPCQRTRRCACCWARPLSSWRAGSSTL